MHDTATLHERPTLAARRPAAGAAPPGLAARWARDEADVRRAQALRHRVFVGEMGARITPPRGTPPGLDADAFDPFCEHLLVVAGQGDAAEVVGTYRVLTPDAARRAGGYYSETEFDLTRLRPFVRSWPSSAARACTRTGATVRPC